MGIQQTKKISVIGIGYIGLPILIELSNKTSLDLVGFDCDKKRVDELKNGIDRNNEHKIREKNNTRLNFSSDKKDIDNSQIYIVTVPTPIDNNKTPNLKSLKSAAAEIGESIKRSFLNSKYSSKKEILIVVETFAFVAFGMLLFAKVLPLIPLFDIKEGMVIRRLMKVGRRTIPASMREGLPHHYYEKYKKDH